MTDVNSHTSSEFDAIHREIHGLLPKGVRRFVNAICPPLPNLSILERINLAGRFATISRNVRCAHFEEEVMSLVHAVLALPDSVEGCIVEAGALKGGSTAKFSIAAGLKGWQLYVFDSFQGLPANDEAYDRASSVIRSRAVSKPASSTARWKR